MKKTIKRALTLVLALCVSATTMFAAKSKTDLVQLTSDNVFIGKDGIAYELRVIAESVSGVPDLTDEMMKKLSGTEVEIVKVWDVNLACFNQATNERITDEKANDVLNFPLYVKFDVSSLNLSSDDKYFLFHYSTVQQEWELISTTLSADGKIMTGTFNSLSPVVLALEKSSGTGGTGNTGDSGDRPTSPNTGAESTAPIMVCVGLAAAAVGYAACRRKRA